MLFIPIRHPCPACKQHIQPFHLGQTQRRAHLVQAVVVAQVGVLQPGVTGRAALVAQGAHEICRLLVIGDDHPALAGGDLLVRVEGKHTVIPQGTGRAAFVGTAQSFAGILDHRQVVLFGDGVDPVIIRRLAEHIHRQDGLERPQPALVEKVQAPGQPLLGQVAPQA